jgi:VWFA-related protein
VRSLIQFTLVGVFAVLGIAPVATPLPRRQGRDGNPFTIAVDADLVVFNLTVADSKGRRVSGLHASDFQVREENQLQEIKLFVPEDGPATVGLIIDNSGSMREKRAEVTQAAIAFATASNSEDEMFVVTFNEKVSLGLPSSVPFTNDLDLIHSALLRNPPNGLTALYDALAFGIEHLKGGTRNHKSLVVLSDGGDNASHLSLNSVLQQARQSSATIYTIGIYDDADQDRNPGTLRKIAESSGGRAYFPQSLQGLEQVWRNIAREIRSEYTIGYHSSNPSHDGKFRSVKITSRRNAGRDLKINTRDGYFVPDDSSIVK